MSFKGSMKQHLTVLNDFVKITKIAKYGFKPENLK